MKPAEYEVILESKKLSMLANLLEDKYILFSPDLADRSITLSIVDTT